MKVEKQSFERGADAFSLQDELAKKKFDRETRHAASPAGTLCAATIGTRHLCLIVVLLVSSFFSDWDQGHVPIDLLYGSCYFLTTKVSDFCHTFRKVFLNRVFHCRSHIA